MVYYVGDAYVGITTNGHGVRFYFIKLKKYFEPNICDIMLIKNSLIQHFTRTHESIGQFGMCMYMQASFFPM
jgi:hypothetical protein